MWDERVIAELKERRRIYLRKLTAIDTELKIAGVQLEEVEVTSPVTDLLQRVEKLEKLVLQLQTTWYSRLFAWLRSLLSKPPGVMP